MRKCICAISLLFLFQCTSCSHRAMPMDSDGPPFTISLPQEWKQVSDEEQVKKHILWAFSNGNYSVWTEHPIYWAWDGPKEIDGFFTIAAVKRDRTLGLGNWYNDVLCWLQEEGVVVQETGTTIVDGARAKWWVQSLADGYIYQQCYMLVKGDYLYTLSFTTPYISPEKLATFEQIVKTMRFQE